MRLAFNYNFPRQSICVAFKGHHSEGVQELDHSVSHWSAIAPFGQFFFETIFCHLCVQQLPQPDRKMSVRVVLFDL